MAQTINHVVVLMLENRGFDHMLGFLTPKTGAIDGLTGNEFNPSNPLSPSDQHFVSRNAGFVLTPDPGHSIPDVNVQLFARPGGPPPIGSPNLGFIWNYSQQHHAPADPTTIMRCFDPANLPVLSTLAIEFGVCDQWFSAVPGPTWPNRFFAHAATSNGHIDNSMFTNYDMPSIFENLAARGLTWRDYYHDFSQTWSLQRLQTPENRVNFHSFGRFKRDARDGKLPNYAFIEPKYFSLFGEANDQHPPHDIRAGEALIADVYEAVRTSPQWLDTLLLITYDEHGGTYDHVLPGEAVPPDNQISQFTFDRYGVRVPAIIVSPFVPAEPVHTVFDHTSIPATLAAVFGLPTFLTARDAQANRFDMAASLPNPRTDIPDLSEHARTVGTPSMTRSARPTVGAGVFVSQDAELSDFQLDLLKLARSLERQHAPLAARSAGIVAPPRTEQEAAVYVRRVAAQMAPRQEAGDAVGVPAAAPAQRGAIAPDDGLGHRVRVRPQADVCLLFAHATSGDPVQVTFVVTDAYGRLLGKSRYMATSDEPYGGGDIEDPHQNVLPPLVSNTGDDDMYVEITAAVGRSFSVPLRVHYHAAEHGVTVVYFTVDDDPILTVFVRT
jgi:phospholipase C